MAEPVRSDRPDAVWLCLVCGLDLRGIDEEPWGSSGTSPTYNFCPCCGVEFGYGDFTLDAARKWRTKWLSLGGAWHEPALSPPTWDSAAQLARLPERAR